MALSDSIADDRGEAEIQELVTALPPVKGETMPNGAKVLPLDDQWSADDIINPFQDYGSYNMLYIIIPIIILVLLLLAIMLYRNYRRYSPHHNGTFIVNDPTGVEVVSLFNASDPLPPIKEEEASFHERDSSNYYLKDVTPEKAPRLGLKDATPKKAPRSGFVDNTPTKTYISSEAFV